MSLIVFAYVQSSSMQRASHIHLHRSDRREEDRIYNALHKITCLPRKAYDARDDLLLGPERPEPEEEEKNQEENQGERKPRRTVYEKDCVSDRAHRALCFKSSTQI